MVGQRGVSRKDKGSAELEHLVALGLPLPHGMPPGTVPGVARTGPLFVRDLTGGLGGWGLGGLQGARGAP